MVVINPAGKYSTISPNRWFVFSTRGEGRGLLTMVEVNGGGGGGVGGVYGFVWSVH